MPVDGCQVFAFAAFLPVQNDFNFRAQHEKWPVFNVKTSHFVFTERMNEGIYSPVVKLFPNRFFPRFNFLNASISACEYTLLRPSLCDLMRPRFSYWISVAGVIFSIFKTSLL